MLAELHIISLGNVHQSDDIAEAVRLIEASGLPYELTPTGTCIEGKWDEVMKLIEQCHEAVRKNSPQVVTSIRIEDQEGMANKLEHNIAAVEEKLGHSVTHRTKPEYAVGEKALEEA